MTCKDCIHYEVCQYKYNIMSKLKNDDVQKYCLNFKDKSRVIELPMKTTNRLNEELTKYCYERCVDEL